MKRWFSLFLLILVACQSGIGTPTQTPTLTLPPAPTATVTPPPTETPTPTAYPRLSFYEQYAIDHLRERGYGDGSIELIQIMENNDLFTRYLIRYPSDGLAIYGFANVPKGAGPYPVIIAIHGYVNANVYETLDYTTDAADGLSREGYVVLHPNLRNYPPSNTGDNLFRVGMAVDVLNLIELVRLGAGPAELFDTANRDRIGLWGHSLGGNIALRVLTVSPDVSAAVLYASLSGDETKNAGLMWNITLDPIYQHELGSSTDLLVNISPANHYGYITSPVQLYHGTADTVVPVRWAEETCSLLGNAGVSVNCIYFPGEDHTFRSRVADEFRRTLGDFYRKYLYP